MTTATAPLSSETGRSELQDSLFSWLEPETTTAAAEMPAPEEKAAPPTEAPTEEEKPESDLSHTWVVAAEVEVTPKIAKIADHRGSFKAVEGQRVHALEVYCKGCRRPYDEVTSQHCAAKIDNRH